MSMADLPLGSVLIENSVSRAPGFKIKNIYVFAGIPKILYGMFESIKVDFAGLVPLLRLELNLLVGEGEITEFMIQIGQEFPQLELGSYPAVDFDRAYKTQIVIKSKDQKMLFSAIARFKELCGPEAFRTINFI